MKILEICFSQKKFFDDIAKPKEMNLLVCQDKNVECDKTVSSLSGKSFEFHSLYKEVPQSTVC